MVLLTLKSIKTGEEEMLHNYVEVTRIEEFCAAHRLNNPDLSDAENKRVFGKCNNAASHGHNYKVRATVRGIPDKVNGMVYDISVLKNALRTVLQQMDHKNLDQDLEYFKSHVSTTENLAIYIWEQLKNIMQKPELLWRIEVEETSKNIFIFYGPQ
uniref:6-pyruvoyl tetrahydrobiopterin synthase n=1 Tax=Syphacia muris TaxID=451379 RepID=A0A0N5ASG4_9BILA